MKEDSLKTEIERFVAECNSMECPDCGGVHKVKVRLLPDGTIYGPEFMHTVYNVPCFGYKRLVHDTINSLKRRYHIGENP